MYTYLYLIKMVAFYGLTKTRIARFYSLWVKINLVLSDIQSAHTHRKNVFMFCGFYSQISKQKKRYTNRTKALYFDEYRIFFCQHRNLTA